MGNLSRVEDLDSETVRKVVGELVRGKKSAVQLQTLLDDDDGCDLQKPRHGSSRPSPEDLSLQILRSFTRALSELSPWAESTQIPQKKKKDRRGCYKRRRSSDSWVVESSTTEDGHAWRKYGQKAILNSQYPRCYYRCTHKPEGCKAMKQVQGIQEDPDLYQTTYFHRHTCSSRTVPTDLTVQYSFSSSGSSNLISFQAADRRRIAGGTMKSENASEEVLSDAKSLSSTLLQGPWEELSGLDSVEYKPEWSPEMAPGWLQPCDELGDFANNFFCFGDDDQMD